jgi:peptidoglycan hydrolase-like protein with peptidoglycan-binding domain
MREHAAEGPAPDATEEPIALAPPAALVGRQPTATAATLAIGATGSKVTSLQMHLNMLDEVKTELAVDAIFGPITRSAVRQFQSAHPPLRATGGVDAETEAAIVEADT